MTGTEAVGWLFLLGPIAFAAGVFAELRYPHLLGRNRRDR